MSRHLMVSSAAVMATAGILLSFLPRELFAELGQTPDGVAISLAQLLGAAYMGFAMVNWMGKGSLVGGIFGRPVALGNFAHFLIGSLAILKVAGHAGAQFAAWCAIVIYASLACAFGYVVFRHPGVSQCG